MPFEIYKRGQGRAARTVAAAGLLGLGAFGCTALRNFVVAYPAWRQAYRIGGLAVEPALVVPAVLFVAAAAGTAWVVGRWRRIIDFLILTESELRKVSWPSREDLRHQTVIVLVVCVIFGILICFADIFLKKVFGWLGLY